MRVNHFIRWWLLVLVAGAVPVALAQTPVNPTADQLMQIVRSQPPVDLSVPVSAMTSFDPPLVRPGEKAVYRVTFNATTVSVNWPEKIPAPAGLKIQLSASGQTMQAVGGEFQNFATFTYAVRADGAGQFVIPEFTVEVYGKPVVVPAVQLEVKAELPVPHESVRQLLVEPAATNVYAGETLSVRVRLPATSGGGVEGLADVQLTGDGFLVDKNAARQFFQVTVENGRRVAAYIYETSITPMAAGPLKLSAQGFTAGMAFGGPVVINGQVSIPGDSQKPILLDSEPATINVRPLPVENELPGFTGAVGQFTSNPPRLTTNPLKAGEPMLLTVIIRGGKNPGRINPPPPPRAEGWQVFPAERGGIVAGVGLTNPGVSFKYTLIPLNDAVRATPAIPFSYFDPVLGKYVNLTIPPIPVKVLPGEALAPAEVALMDSDGAAGPEPKAGLSKLATTPGWITGRLVPWQLHGWFPLVQLLPALGFCGLWFWDRRRRFLEQHPEIIRRRKARRALRRELRLLEQAAAKNEPAQFVRRAINAFQIASAPHYPATPRALVCGDVLQILTAPERAGKPGETVRRFFAAADAAMFADSSADQTKLLAEKPALKEILLKLEARL